MKKLEIRNATFLHHHAPSQLRVAGINFHGLCPALPLWHPISAAVFSKMLGDISLNNRQDAKKEEINSGIVVKALT